MNADARRRGAVRGVPQALRERDLARGPLRDSSADWAASAIPRSASKAREYSFTSPVRPNELFLLWGAADNAQDRDELFALGDRELRRAS